MKQEVRISLNLVELAAGVLRILSFLLLAAACLTTAALVMMALRMPASDSLWYLMHEMDDELLGAFFFWGGFAVIGYLARMAAAGSGQGPAYTACIRREYRADPVHAGVPVPPAHLFSSGRDNRAAVIKKPWKKFHGFFA